MTQFYISVKSLIPLCQTLARTAPEFTECNSNSASMSFFFPFFAALIGHLAACICCKMDFPLNQQKQPSEIQHRATAPQITREASAPSVATKRFAQKQRFVICPRRESRTGAAYASSCWSCPTFSGEQMQCPRSLVQPSSFSVTHLHRDVSVVHATTTHAFVSFTDSFTVPHRDRLEVTLDYTPPPWMTVLYTPNASKVKGSAAAVFCGNRSWPYQTSLPPRGSAERPDYTPTSNPPEHFFVLIQHFVFIPMYVLKENSVKGQKLKLQHYIFLQKFIQNVRGHGGGRWLYTPSMLLD